MPFCNACLDMYIRQATELRVLLLLLLLLSTTERSAIATTADGPTFRQVVVTQQSHCQLQETLGLQQVETDLWHFTVTEFRHTK